MTLEIQIPDCDSDKHVEGINWLIGISIFKQFYLVKKICSKWIIYWFSFLQAILLFAYLRYLCLLADRGVQHILRSVFV